MQVSEFFMPYLYITQGENIGSHEGTYNIDYSGRNEMGKLKNAPIYAPFDYKCVYAENSYSSGNCRIIQSIDKVKTPIGEIYVTLAYCHDNKPILKKGDKGKKGTIIGRTGTYGKVTGDHSHVLAAKGTFKGFDNSGKHQQLKNAEHQYNLFYIDNVIVEKDGGYNWKKNTPEPTKNNYKCLGNMYVRYGAGLNYGIKRVKELTEDGRKHCTTPDRPSADAIYKSGTVFTALEVINTTKYGLWAKSPSGYICIKGKSGREYCIKC